MKEEVVKSFEHDVDWRKDRLEAGHGEEVSKTEGCRRAASRRREVSFLSCALPASNRAYPEAEPPFSAGWPS